MAITIFMDIAQPSQLQIPDDIDACQAMLRELHTAYTRLHEVYHALLDTCESISDAKTKLEQEKETLELTIKELTRRIYGRRSERHCDPNQKWLDFGEEAPGEISPDVSKDEKIVEEFEAKRRQRRQRRRRRQGAGEKFPAHLERRTTRVEPDLPPGVSPEDCEEIGVDVVEVLDMEPPVLFVQRNEYPKYRLPDVGEESPISQAPRLPSLIPGGSFGFGLAAEILNHKFALHVPLYRQQDMFSQFGWSPSRSTLCQIVATSAELLEPLATLEIDRVLSASILHTDDTEVTLLTPGEGKGSRKARLWIYLTPEAESPYNVFAFTNSRSREGPDSFLERFQGTLCGDCYSGYVNIDRVTNGRIRFAACHAHARRYVYNAKEQHPELSSSMLAVYSQLYDIEDRARELDAGERLSLRQRESVPLMASLERLVHHREANRLLPKSPLAKAVNYIRGHWEAFCCFLGDGRVAIDNNVAERGLRRVAVGRKNWLFVGSEKGGERLSTILTVISSAHRHDLDVSAYLKDVLSCLASGGSDLASLLPDVWKRSHPDKVRKFREKERRDIADKKRYRRAKRRLSRSGK